MSNALIYQKCQTQLLYNSIFSITGTQYLENFKMSIQVLEKQNDFNTEITNHFYSF